MSIVSVGYEGVTLVKLVEDLKLRGVQTLVDVRLNAISRKVGFSKKALSAALEDSGIHYLHFPELGNERDNRPGYKELSTPSGLAARDRFRLHLKSELAGERLADLAQLAVRHRIAVFCYEKDECHCHRQQVIEGIVASGNAGC